VESRKKGLHLVVTVQRTELEQWLTILLLQFESPALEQLFSQWQEEQELDAVLRVHNKVATIMALHLAITKTTTTVVATTARRQVITRMVVTSTEAISMAVIITMAHHSRAITMVVPRTVLLPTSPAPADLTAQVNLREVRTPTDPAWVMTRQSLLTSLLRRRLSPTHASSYLRLPTSLRVET
jgi:hypothetical protein